MRGTLIVLMAAALAGGAAAAPPDPAVLSYKLPQDIPWTGDPAKGPQTYVIWGDPTKPGPYALLVKWPPHMMSRPHTHPHERYITVLSGTWWVGTGKTYDPDSTTPMPAGASVVHFANQFHYDGAKDEPAVLEIVGEGPQ
jgi:hypothetical protein